jgi:protein-L-isoaspartate(D-aspartate) O-methyltransferase
LRKRRGRRFYFASFAIFVFRILSSAQAGVDLRLSDGIIFSLMQIHVTDAILNLAACAGPVLFCVVFRADGEDDTDWAADIEEMLRQLSAYKIRDERVLAAMASVRRHLYMRPEYRKRTNPYGDHPSPIGGGQTISQPYIVAYMTECLDIKQGEKVLEIGTGSGYQAAVLAEMGAEVYTVEISPELAELARKTLRAEGYGNVHVLIGDGYKGWPVHSPFDAILATCAPEDVPAALVDQLKDGGRMVLPVGAGVQRLVILRKHGGELRQQDDIWVTFVPMVHGKQGGKDKTSAR